MLELEDMVYQTGTSNLLSAPFTESRHIERKKIMVENDVTNIFKHNKQKKFENFCVKPAACWAYRVKKKYNYTFILFVYLPVFCFILIEYLNN